MGILQRFARRRSRHAAASRLYLGAVEQARTPDFYTRYGVPDPTEARFALVSLHVHLLCRRLSRESAETGGALAQALFDTMFTDIDRNLREMGVGDLSVGKKIKKLAAGHYAAAQRIEWALEDGDAALAAAVAGSLGEGVTLSGEEEARIAAYVHAAIDGLAAQEAAALLDGRAAFPAAV
jgi:cytochrome b pre-mRNA-processing protein 3